MKKTIIISLLWCILAPTTIEAKKKLFGNGFYCEINGTTLVISGRGNMPEYWECKGKKYPWWSSKHVKEPLVLKIIFEEGITSIGGVFYHDCLPYVKDIQLPNSLVRIGDYAFQNARIKEITLPQNLKSVGHKAFYKSDLQSIILPPSLTDIGSEAFSESQLRDIQFPQNIKQIPYGICSETMGTGERFIERHCLLFQ